MPFQQGDVPEHCLRNMPSIVANRHNTYTLSKALKVPQFLRVREAKLDTHGITQRIETPTHPRAARAETCNVFPCRAELAFNKCIVNLKPLDAMKPESLRFCPKRIHVKLRPLRAMLKPAFSHFAH